MQLFTALCRLFGDFSLREGHETGLWSPDFGETGPNRRESKIVFAAVVIARRVRCPVWVAETGRLGLLDSQAVRNAAIYAALSLFSRFQPPRRPRIRPLEA